MDGFDSISKALRLIYTDLELMGLFLGRLCFATWWGWRHAAQVLELERSIEANPIIKMKLITVYGIMRMIEVFS